jgi:hypothetical protein
VKHSSRKAIKIYVVTQENKVDIVFDNTQKEVEAGRSEESFKYQFSPNSFSVIFYWIKL